MSWLQLAQLMDRVMVTLSRVFEVLIACVRYFKLRLWRDWFDECSTHM